MNNFQNPAYVSRVNVDEVERELLRVRDTIGDTFVLPDWAGALHHHGRGTGRPDGGGVRSLRRQDAGADSVLWY